MLKVHFIAVSLVSALFGSAVLADVQCNGPTKDGNTWNLICSEDGSGDSDYSCEYHIALTNTEGETGTVTASGTVGQKQTNIIIWSGIQHSGADIASASISDGSCTAN